MTRELPKGPFATIVMDPPWAYRINPLTPEERAAKATKGFVLRDGTVSHRQRGPVADHVYATMTHAEIAALPIGDIAAEQAHLYLWITNPRLFADKAGRGPDPFEMMQGWGFSYTTMLTWRKLGAPGMGWYFRGDTEHVLFGVRGKLRVPVEARRSNFFEAKRGKHSEKPELFYEIAERVSPGPRVDLFARRARPGWVVWGDEAPVGEA